MYSVTMSGFTTCVFLVCIGITHGWLFGPKEKCYDIYGTNECFSTKAPYDNTDNKVPESPDHQQVRFALYTPINSTSPQFLCGTDPSCLTSSYFDGSKKTRIITHGYTDEFDEEWVKSMTAELIKYDDSNVIAVDWEKGADNNLFNYYQSAANTRVVGALLAKIIQQIVDTDTSTNLASFHLIGHSLGAHVSAEAGKRFNGQLGRITGLDPAGAGFGLKDAQVRLDKTDAQFVDVIHTDGKKLHELGFGTMTEMGNADFYPNGGFDQPGCGSISDLVCNHWRALLVFTESINSACQFTSYPCSSIDAIKEDTCTQSGTTARMGFHADSSASGKYYLTTNDESPYCQS